MTIPTHNPLPTRECSIPLGDRVFVPHYNAIGKQGEAREFQGIVVRTQWYEPKMFRSLDCPDKPALYRLVIIPDDRHCLECCYDEDEVIMLGERLTKEEMLTHWSEQVRQLGLEDA